MRPGASPKPIRIHFAGADRLQLTPSGDLTIHAPNGQISFHKPDIYQEIDGRRQPIQGRFTLLAGNMAAFSLGSYNHAQPLVIDPILAYSTYLGGSLGAQVAGIEVDASGNAFVAGIAYSKNFPVTTGVFQPTNRAAVNYNAFLTKLNPAGTALIYSTYLGGTSNDGALALAIDSSGNAYLSGFSESVDFPVTAGAFQHTNRAAAHPGPFQDNAFVAKLNPTGSALLYSTFLGGSGHIGGSGSSLGGDAADAIAIDSSGNAYVTGYAQSTDFPVTAGAVQPTIRNLANTNAFVAKVNPTGSALVYSTYLGGSGDSKGGERGKSIAADSSGNAYVTGWTCSADFPVTAGAFQTTIRGSATQSVNAFVTKLNPTGTALLYSTFLGGTKGENGMALALDGSGSAYVAGIAESADFPVTTGVFQPTLRGYGNAFVTKLNPAGTALLFSTYLGGTYGEAAYSFTLDGSGNVIVAGETESADFPVTAGAIQSTNRAISPGFNGFVAKLNPTATALLYSTYLGGTVGDQANGVAVDGSGNVYVTGDTSSTDFPVTAGAFQSTNHGGMYGATFVTKLNLGSPAVTTTTLVASANPQFLGQPVTFTATVTGTATAAVPTGSVTFSVDKKAGSTVAVIKGTATLSPSTLAVGPHVIVASYSGSSGMAGAFASSSSSLTETVTLPQASAPIFSPAVGPYTTTLLVTLTDLTKGAAIYYTINGKAPTTASTRYTAPISVSQTTTIQASPWPPITPTAS